MLFIEKLKWGDNVNKITFETGIIIIRRRSSITNYYQSLSTLCNTCKYKDDKVYTIVFAWMAIIIVIIGIIIIIIIIIRILKILAIKGKENIFHKNHNIVACNKIFMFWYICIYYVLYLYLFLELIWMIIFILIMFQLVTIKFRNRIYKVYQWRKVHTYEWISIVPWQQTAAIILIVVRHDG